ncbi:Uncharacterised protein [BD1-7 clade bacterium]|uniref:HEPN AbiU2-like domain-containing protein n=1 Tax=BD1-7 clade bacterium TaxID=2029982 RepID=A0A5S9QJE6_9GAMM|nr:Uncharacterised protein [BD1-7 clade bacterium]
MEQDERDNLDRVVYFAKDFGKQYVCWKASMAIVKESDVLSVTISNNFFDMALLCWGHFFGNRSDELHYTNVLAQPDQFKSYLIDNLGINENDWNNNWLQLKDFRDKRIAHFDSDVSVVVPGMELAFECVKAYHDEALKRLKECDPLYEIEPDFDAKHERYELKIKGILGCV